MCAHCPNCLYSDHITTSQYNKAGGVATVNKGYILFPSRIDANHTIKVADFGLSESVYTRNYYRQNIQEEGAKLPMKWMAIESLHDGVFNEKTDVVSCTQLRFQPQAFQVHLS